MKKNFKNFNDWNLSEKKREWKDILVKDMPVLDKAYLYILNQEISGGTFDDDFKSSPGKFGGTLYKGKMYVMYENQPLYGNFSFNTFSSFPATYSGIKGMTAKTREVFKSDLQWPTKRAAELFEIYKNASTTLKFDQRVSDETVENLHDENRGKNLHQFGTILQKYDKREILIRVGDKMESRKTTNIFQRFLKKPPIKITGEIVAIYRSDDQLISSYIAIKFPEYIEIFGEEGANKMTHTLYKEANTLRWGWVLNRELKNEIIPEDIGEEKQEEFIELVRKGKFTWEEVEPFLTIEQKKKWRAHKVLLGRF